MNKNLLKYIFLFLSTHPVLSKAELNESLSNDYTITFSGNTYHLSRRDRNEDNNIFGIRYKNIELFTLINSFENRAFALTFHKQWELNSFSNIGFRAGGVTGYTKEENSIQLLGVTPVLAPTINFHHKKVGVEVSLQTDVLVFSLNYSF